MAIDKNKISEAATKYIQKGQLDKAIKEYRKIIAADPKDARIQQKLGELYARNGESAQAIECFLKVAEGYTTDGFLLKAIAVYKQIIKISPERIDIHLILAQLHQQLGLLGDAMTQYQAIVAHYEAAGNLNACMETLNKIVELDPDNTVMRIKLAELRVNQGMNEEAVEELLKVRDYFKKNNRTDDYIKISERIIFLDSKRIDLVQEIAAQYLAMGEAQRALAKLQICFRANPKDIETLSLLARAFQMSGEIPKTASIYKELARIYGAKNQSQLEKETWNKVLQLVPNDPEALRHLNPKAPAPAPAPRMPPATAKPPPSPAPVAAQPANTAQPSKASGAQQATANLARLLNEVDVYIKYGLTDKALDHLAKIFEAHPKAIEAHEKAAKVHLARKSPPEAFHHVFEALRLRQAAGDKAGAMAALEQLREISPRHPALANLRACLEQGTPLPATLKFDAPPVEEVLEVIEIADLVEEEASPAPTSPEAKAPEMEVLGNDAFLDPEDDGGIVFEIEPEAPAKQTAQPEAVEAAKEEEEIDWASLPDIELDVRDEAPKAPVQKEPEARPSAPRASAAESEIDWALLDATAEPEEVQEIELVSESKPEPVVDAREDAIDWASLGDDDNAAQAIELISEPEPAPAPAVDAREDAVDWALIDAVATSADADEAQQAIELISEPEPEPAVAAPRMDTSVDWALLNEAIASDDAQVVGVSPARVESRAPFTPTPDAVFAVAPEAVAADEVPVANLDDLLDEAAFFINQADLKSAREALGRASNAYPGNARVEEMLILLEAHEQYYAEQQAAFEQAVAEETAYADQDAEAGADMAFDRLTTAALFDTDMRAEASAPDRIDSQFSFDSLFSEFKKGIEQIVRPEDIETHYDLGQSYREMELFDDAIGEFEQAMSAAKGQPKELDCLTMIAICQIAAGRLDTAEQTLQTGLASPLLTPPTEAAIRFELASLYETQGRTAEALAEFLRLEQDDPDYRDISHRIAALRMSAG